ncbi:hypothetical protein D3C72_1635560 [compost metagenome]
MPVTVIVTELLAGRLAMVPLTTLPATVTVAGHNAPPVGLPQVAATPVIEDGTVSLKLVPLASVGPALPTSKVYWIGAPGTTAAGPLLTTEISALGSMSVLGVLAEPLAWLGTSVALTVLTMFGAVMLDANITGTLKVSVPLAAAGKVAPVTANWVCPPAPVIVPQVAVPVAVQVGAPVRVTPAGRESDRFTCPAFAGPVFCAVIVYVAVAPGV